MAINTTLFFMDIGQIMNDSIIFIFCCGILLGSIVWYFARKRALHSSAQKEAAQRKKIVYALLEKALDQRSTLRIENALQNDSAESIQGTCTQITQDALFVTVNNTVNSVDLVEKTVKIYFTVNLKRKLNYFQCIVKVLDCKPSAGSLLLHTSLPKSIDTGQKRNFVRVTPHKEAVLALAIWPVDEQNVLPAQSADLPHPLLQYRPNKIHEVTLDNISGGGMRVIITVEESLQSDIDLTLGGRLLVLVVLRSDETYKPMPYWVIGKIRMVSELKSPQNGIAVGFSYLHWAAMEKGKDTLISWFPADASGGIAPLATWTMRHHLEQHKIL